MPPAEAAPAADAPLRCRVCVSGESSRRERKEDSTMERLDEACFQGSLRSTKAEFNCKCCQLTNENLKMLKVTKWLFCTVFLFCTLLLSGFCFVLFFQSLAHPHKLSRTIAWATALYLVLWGSDFPIEIWKLVPTQGPTANRHSSSYSLKHSGRGVGWKTLYKNHHSWFPEDLINKEQHSSVKVLLGPVVW